MFNYWLHLIEKEKNLKKEIARTIRKSIGKKFSGYSDMSNKVKEDIRLQLENYGVKNHMGVFRLEYDIDLKWDSSFVLTGYEVKFVHVLED